MAAGTLSKYGFSALLALSLAACDAIADQPDAVGIVRVERRPDIRLPRRALPPDQFVALAIHLPREQLHALAGYAGGLGFDIFSCSVPNRWQGSELYLNGQRIGWRYEDDRAGLGEPLLEREAEARSKGPIATLIAIVRRSAIDADTRRCGLFHYIRGHRIIQLGRAIRLPPLQRNELPLIGVSIALVDRPAGIGGAEFADRLIVAEGRRLRIDSAIDEDVGLERIGVIEISDGRNRDVHVYYPTGEPDSAPGQVCLVRSLKGHMSGSRERLYRFCASDLGIPPESEAPRAPHIATVCEGRPGNTICTPPRRTFDPDPRPQYQRRRP